MNIPNTDEINTLYTIKMNVFGTGKMNIISLF